MEADFLSCSLNCLGMWKKLKTWCTFCDSHERILRKFLGVVLEPKVVYGVVGPEVLFQPSSHRCTIKGPGRNLRITASAEHILAHIHPECPEDTYELFHPLAHGILFCRLNTFPSFVSRFEI